MTSIAPTPTTLRQIPRLPEGSRAHRQQGRVNPVALATHMAMAYLEARSGRRALQQLRDVLPHDAYRRLQWAELRERHQPARGGTSVHRVLTCAIAPDVVEVAVVVRDGDVIRGVAVRMEHHGHWRVADIGLPEDRPRGVRRRDTS
jgi:hypothetical protein